MGKKNPAPRMTASRLKWLRHLELFGSAHRREWPGACGFRRAPFDCAYLGWTEWLDRTAAQPERVECLTVVGRRVLVEHDAANARVAP